MNIHSSFQSHFDFLSHPVCHVGCAQFERQWPPENSEPLSHPISKNFQWLALWHAPKEHEIWIDEKDLEEAQAWIKNFKRKREGIPRLCHRNNPPKLPLFFWSPSPSALLWAEKKGLSLDFCCSLSSVKKIHDKRWLEQNRSQNLLTSCPSKIISSYEEIEALIGEYPHQNWMFKQSWNAAGLGNCPFQAGSKIPPLLKKWIDLNHVIIAQPLLEKVLDFSSLWWISASGTIHFFALTQMLIEKKSRYTGCLIDSAEEIFKFAPSLWDQHLKQATNLLNKAKAEGYFGYIGFDAMIYKEKDSLIQAIIEINARQTLAMHLVSIANTQKITPTKATLKFKAPVSISQENLTLFPQTAGPLSIVFE